MFVRTYHFLSWSILGLLLLVWDFNAQGENTKVDGPVRAFYGLAYFVPTDTESRDIKTINAITYRLLFV